MTIAILDDSRVFLKHIENMLKKMNYQNIHLFNNENDFYNFCAATKNIDIVFIDYHLKSETGFDVLEKTKYTLNNTYKILITSDSDPDLKEKALKLGFDSFLEKKLSFIDFQVLMNTIFSLRKYINKETEKKEMFEKLLKNKEKEEKIIHLKQNKIMKNELEMFYDENYLFETYFKPKDLLTGDTLYTKKLSQNEYFISIIDAMGKGLSASLTSFNALAFLKHSISKAIEYNDFNFEKLIRDFINYVKTILLENEILCATLVYIKNDTLYYVNFANPPILTESKIIKANNFPININTENFKIDKINMEEKILISSDGIFESPYDESIYFKRLKEIFPNISFLKELLEDFYAKSHQIDDTCMVFISREKDYFETVFESRIELNKKDINSFLEKIYELEIPQKEIIHLILHEILINTYEHGIIKIKNKDNIDEKIKLFNDSKKNCENFARIKITKNPNRIKIVYNDNTPGFDVQTIKDAFYKKYHGRGIKIIKHLSYGLFFNSNGTSIKIFLKA